MISSPLGFRGVELGALDTPNFRNYGRLVQIGQVIRDSQYQQNRG